MTASQPRPVPPLVRALLDVREIGQRKNFIADVEQAVPAFYETVGQHLRAYQSPAPRIREDRSGPDSVTREGLQQDAEE